MATRINKLQNNVEAVGDARRRLQVAKDARDKIMEQMEQQYADIFDEYELARQHLEDTEKAARELIAATPKDQLPSEFSHRVSKDWNLDTDEARQWILVNLPALMQPIKKDVIKVLNTGVFKRVPIDSHEVITATISQKLGKVE